MAGVETNAPPDEQKVIEDAIADGLHTEGDSRIVPFDVSPGTPSEHVVEANVRRLRLPQSAEKGAVLGKSTFWYDGAAYHVAWRLGHKLGEMGRVWW